MTTSEAAAAGTLYADEHIFAVTRRNIDAWNRGDLDATVEAYAEDVVYRDPKIRGLLHGRTDLRRYLAKFFRVWRTTFEVTDERRIAGENAQLCRWECTFVYIPTGKSVRLPGMDLCVVRGQQLARDEAFMDTLPFENLKS